MNGRSFARRSLAEALLKVNLELEDKNVGERNRRKNGNLICIFAT